MKKSKKCLNELLYNGARLGDMTVVQNCVEIEANINCTDKWGWSALNVASFRGHIHVVRFLISKGAEVDQEDVSCYTALCRAAQKGHKDVIKVLLKAGAQVNHRNRRGNTPLALAAYWGHVDVVKILLMNGADIDVKNNVGVTALTLASTESEEIVKILICIGADSTYETIDLKSLQDDNNTEENNRRNPLYPFIPTEKEKIEIAIILHERGTKMADQQTLQSLLLHAAKIVEPEYISIMVRKDVDINVTDVEGNTALHNAAGENLQENVKILLEAGADWNIQNNKGQLPVHVAKDDNIKDLISSFNLLETSKVEALEADKAHESEEEQQFSTNSKNIYSGSDPILKLEKEEAETWEASVPDRVADGLNPQETKHQEHIYEFIMTEKHHFQMLKKIQKIFFEEMKIQLDMNPDLLEKIFPQLDNLLDIHSDFLKQLRIQQVNSFTVFTVLLFTLKIKSKL